MSNRTLIYSFFLLILFTLIGCGGATIAPPAPTAATEIAAVTAVPLAPETGINLLLDDAGQTQIKRTQSGWNSYQPAGFGTAVQRGDLILPPSGAETTILCADFTIHTIEQEDGSPCQVTEPKLIWEGARIVNPRAPGNTIPYILHPRRTAILDGRPLLRWHDTGAGSYTVAIIQGGEAIWRQEGVNAAQLRYPDDVPPLDPGVSYLLEVKDEDTGASSGEDPVKGLGFQLLSPEEAAPIMKTRDEVMALPLDAAAQNFALAVYYAGQGLYGVALDALDEAALTRESPQVLLWRGRILLAVRLNDDAQTAYAAALALAETLGDVESQAQAQAELWRVTRDESYFDAAITLYQQLGDEQTITDLQEEK